MLKEIDMMTKEEIEILELLNALKNYEKKAEIAPDKKEALSSTLKKINCFLDLNQALSLLDNNHFTDLISLVSSVLSEYKVHQPVVIHLSEDEVKAASGNDFFPSGYGPHSVSSSADVHSEKSEYFPKRFEKTGSDLRDIDGDNLYKVTILLSGRGQPGMAAFYKADTGPELLIKEDQPDTCLLEGSAYYVQKAGLVPTWLYSSVNFARAGDLKETGTKNITVSIQKRVVKSEEKGSVVPLDVVILKHKRNPKTLFSEESWYPVTIDRQLSYMTSDPQWKLVGGIYASQLVGDESLHIAQFMAKVNGDNFISGVVRIDFGARERFSVARDKAKDLDPTKTSSFYSQSGQCGKNYLGYYLKNPQLKFKLMCLHAFNGADTEAVQTAIRQESYKAFISEFEKIPEALKGKSIQGVLDTINNKSEKEKHGLKKGDEGLSVVSEEDYEVVEVVDKKDKQTNKEHAEELANRLSNLDVNRAIVMNQKAKEELKTILDKMEKNVKELKVSDLLYLPAINAMDFQKDLLEKNGALKCIDDVFQTKENNCVLKLYGALKQALEDKGLTNPENLNSVIVASEVLESTLESVKLILLKNDRPLNSLQFPIDEVLTAVDTIRECAAYSLKTQDDMKKYYALTLMTSALNGESAMRASLGNSKMLDEMKNVRGVLQGMAASVDAHYVSVAGVVDTKSSGHLLLEHLFYRYKIPIQHLNLSPSLRELFENIKAKNGKIVNEYISKMTFGEIMKANEFGETPLHLLMETADNKLEYNAILTMLYKSLGTTKITDANLNIRDNEGNTPFHYLSINPKKEDIINYINEAEQLHFTKAFGLGRGRMQVKDFFNGKMKNNAGETPSDLGQSVLSENAGRRPNP